MSNCCITTYCDFRPIEVTANEMGEITAARMTSEDGVVVDKEDALLKPL